MSGVYVEILEIWVSGNLWNFPSATRPLPTSHEEMMAANETPPGLTHTASPATLKCKFNSRQVSVSGTKKQPAANAQSIISIVNSWLFSRVYTMQMESIPLYPLFPLQAQRFPHASSWVSSDSSWFDPGAFEGHWTWGMWQLHAAWRHRYHFGEMDMLSYNIYIYTYKLYVYVYIYIDT